MKLMVYNCESDSCREVTVTPNAAWGGEGRYLLSGRAAGRDLAAGGGPESHRGGVEAGLWVQRC